LALIVVD